MFETIKAVLDILSKGANLFDPSRWKKEKQLKKLRGELFLLYINLNQLLIRGDEIGYLLFQRYASTAYRRISILTLFFTGVITIIRALLP